MTCMRWCSNTESVPLLVSIIHDIILVRTQYVLVCTGLHYYTFPVPVCTEYVPVRTNSEQVRTKYPIPVMQFTIPDGPNPYQNPASGTLPVGHCDITCDIICDIGHEWQRVRAGPTGIWRGLNFPEIESNNPLYCYTGCTSFQKKLFTKQPRVVRFPRSLVDSHLDLNSGRALSLHCRLYGLRCYSAGADQSATVTNSLCQDQDQDQSLLRSLRCQNCPAGMLRRLGTHQQTQVLLIPINSY